MRQLRSAADETAQPARVAAPRGNSVNVGNRAAESACVGGTLAFVQACGSPDATRSHFDAQDFMESGTPGVRTTQDGWLNRTLAQIPGAHSPAEALSLGPTVPRILAGRVPVANIPLGRAAARPMPMDRPIIEAAFDRLYTGSDPLSRAYRDGRLGAYQARQ